MQRKPVRLSIWIAALCLIGASGRASAHDAPQLVEIRVESILASYPPANLSPEHLPSSHMDARLTSEGVGKRLRALFDFSNYRLIRSQNESTLCGQPVAFNLPGGHILHLQPFAAEGDELAMSVMMFEGPHLVMHMPFRTESGGVLFLIDQHLRNRCYITAISVESRMLLHHRQHLAEPDTADAPIPAFPVLVPAQ
ncbi:MAG: hypothetical protein ACREQT_16885 [Candidatus Binataceae bacterium]